jgi:hypothetical protein
VGFAFADGHAKLVYDLSPTQQIRATALGGRSTLDTLDEPLVGGTAEKKIVPGLVRRLHVEAEALAARIAADG